MFDRSVWGDGQNQELRCPQSGSILEIYELILHAISNTRASNHVTGLSALEGDTRPQGMQCKPIRLVKTDFKRKQQLYFIWTFRIIAQLWCVHISRISTSRPCSSTEKFVKLEEDGYLEESDRQKFLMTLVGI